MLFEPRLLTMFDGSDVVDAVGMKKRRLELLEILSREEYGHMPPPPVRVAGRVVETETRVCASHAAREKIIISFDTPSGEFSFPIHLVIPNGTGKRPFVVFINFRPGIIDEYLPVEEIVDEGVAIAVMCYEDVTSDDPDFSNGLAGRYPRSGSGDEWGKIGVWAFAASRVLDYCITRDELDPRRAAVAGHSRLGKTALWCGANDERFSVIYSNDSGCGGAAYERVKHTGAETISDIARTFPFWFCANRSKYAGHPESMPFDQHFLIAACCPRSVGVGSASDDAWADPYSEQLSCVGASPAWEVCGAPGLIAPDRPAAIGESFDGGRVAYHLRHGGHFFSRADWRFLTDIIKRSGSYERLDG